MPIDMAMDMGKQRFECEAMAMNMDFPLTVVSRLLGIQLFGTHTKLLHCKEDFDSLQIILLRLRPF